MITDRAYGIGLGRTGTSSLCRAFKVLGFSPVQHNPHPFGKLRHLAAGAEGCCMLHWKYLEQAYPEAKFILTTRNVDDWIRSCRRAIEDIYPASRMTRQCFHDEMHRNRVVRYGGIDFNEYRLRLNYHRHVHEVLEYFRDKQERLLVMSVESAGWEPLCAFLDRPVPDSPYPHENAS